MDYQSLKIFALDDDVIFAKTLEVFLINQGFTNLQFFESSAPMLAQLSEKPHVLILDHFLRLELGFDVLKRVRAEYPNVKVFYMSSQEKAKIAIQALRLGAVDYFEKNMEGLETLVSVMEREFGLSPDVYLDGE